jgi:hypothetical protein
MPHRTAGFSIPFVLLLAATARAGTLDGLLDPIHPDVKKWATVVVVGENDDGRPTFQWHHYRDSRDAVNFWPASTIKLYAVVAALEKLNELGMPLDSVLIFERRTEGRWVLDAARTVPEMISGIFKRSSNEDYTLLLRFVGIDRINTDLLVPERGFPHSALMRGYVRGRPYEYVREEPQRITLLTPSNAQADASAGSRLEGPRGRWLRVEHTWSGISYANERGATVLSDTTGNCTSTGELADCLRRIVFHDSLPPGERFRITSEQAQFLREGREDLVGLENRNAKPIAWDGGLETVFPKARYLHKSGWISNYCLDAAYVDDAVSGTRFLLVVAAETGDEKTIQQMARRIAEWMGGRDVDPAAR